MGVLDVLPRADLLSTSRRWLEIGSGNNVIGLDLSLPRGDQTEIEPMLDGDEVRRCISNKATLQKK